MAFGILMGLGLAFVAFVVPLMALSRVNAARRDIDKLQIDVRELQRLVAVLRRTALAPTEEAPSSEPVTTPPASVPESAPAPVAEPEDQTPEDIPAAAREQQSPPETALPRPRLSATPEPSMEERLTSRWFVWLGGVALALGGLFLVKYSLDMGLLGPTTRIVLGILLGIALVIGGEIVRQRPEQRLIAAAGADYVPAALSAAGVAIGYASVYVGYLLYDLYSPLVAFAALALVSLAAIGLALLQGPFIAALGLVGGYLTPMLVGSDQPDALALFPYLLVISGAGVGILRYRGWIWLLWLTIIGAVGWIFLWYAFTFARGDTAIIGLYILALFGLLTYFRPRFMGVPGEDGPPLLEWRLDQMPMPERVVAVGCGFLIIAALFMVTTDHFGRTGVVYFALIAVATVFIGRREPVFAAMPRAAGLAAVALIAIWDLPRAESFAETFFWPMNGPLLPAELVPIAVAAVIWGAIFAIGGFIALWGAPRPGHWAALSASVPIALATMLHARLNHFETNLAWAPVAILLAVMCLAGAVRCAKYRDAPGINGALGAYSVGVIAAMSLAFAMVFKEAWLTVALALQIPGVAYVDSKLDVKALRVTALIGAAIVIVRLLANIEIFSYDVARGPYAVSWILYGYGIPCLCFYSARKIFGSRADALLATVLEAGALAFAVTFASLEIRHLTSPGGRLDAGYSSPTEHALQTLTWLAVALVLYWRDSPEASRVVGWGWRILCGLACANILVIELLVYNPLIFVAQVGATPILNTLLLAFAAPALIAAVFMRIAQWRGDKTVASFSGFAALALSFIWLTLEVRHAFHGSVLSILSGPSATTAELYTYSAAWLLYGAGLLALGLWRGSSSLRHASLALILLTIAKVFLYDMSILTGLYRVLSFLGLGFALVGIGFLYQRFVFPVARTKEQS